MGTQNPPNGYQSVCYPWSLAKLSAEVEFKLLHLWLDQIIPTVPHSQPEVTICRNPLPSAFGQHFYLALADPIHDAELVREAGMIAGLKATKFEVREEGREIVLTPGSPSQGTLRTGAVLALVL